MTFLTLEDSSMLSNVRECQVIHCQSYSLCHIDDRPICRSQKTNNFCSASLTLQFTLLTLLKDGKVNFIVELSTILS